ncbi:arf-GAP with coiled-coil, ANK repeat and PH domain-containing protein 1 [Spea bombifrons]|uniref:arf-GAP with coiled-coil, ANK repeat and PH domain-containing protein 1 n=1 Tax=Spea bombifrons TaxID=233779 RepID=UPI00234A3E86|nr:arf-GAP with coiled-coil, ANK repeat and PH domain-containing protein 1 [Spea bombifrons]
MTVTLDFAECLTDSPRTRAAMEEVESEVSDLESRLEKLVKLSAAMADGGRQYCGASRQFVGALRDLSSHAPGDSVLKECLKRFTDGLGAMVDSHTDLLDSIQESFKHKLLHLLKEDLRSFRDSRKELERCREGLESVLHHNAEISRKKTQEVQDSAVSVYTARRAFRERALEYALQINVIQGKKKFDILQFMLQVMDAHATFLAQSQLAIQSLDQYRRDLATQVHQSVLEAAREQRDLEQKLITIKDKEVSDEDAVSQGEDASSDVVIEGYLFKRASNTFKTWSRRWFSIQNNQLVYQKKVDVVTVVVVDLRLCAVKLCPDADRRFCFEVVSPTKSCMLQAESERVLQLWVSAVQRSITTAYNDNKRDSGSLRLPRSATEAPEQQRGLQCAQDAVLRVPGNAACCDCRAAEPEWASINLGVTLCIECSGIHRSLGVHFSKVRSLTLDSWEPELIKLMCELGNNTINAIYEARVEEMNIKKPTSCSTRSEKEIWIRAKYVEKKFITKLPQTALRTSAPQTNRPISSPEVRSAGHRPNSGADVKPQTGRATAATARQRGSEHGADAEENQSLSRLRKTPKPVLRPKPGLAPPMRGGGCGYGEAVDVRSLHPGALLYRAAEHRYLPTMADALAHGADVNWVRADEDGKTPLIRAVLSDSLVACEFLLQNGANVNQADKDGRGPLHHATLLGYTGLACLFLKRGADINAVDTRGKDVLSIAIETANADIVTLLRLVKMRDSDLAHGQAGDETFMDIFRDFSLMASDAPEKLSRRSHDMRLSTL